MADIRIFCAKSTALSSLPGLLSFTSFLVRLAIASDRTSLIVTLSFDHPTRPSSSLLLLSTWCLRRRLAGVAQYISFTDSNSSSTSTLVGASPILNDVDTSSSLVPPPFVKHHLRRSHPVDTVLSPGKALLGLTCRRHEQHGRD